MPKTAVLLPAVLLLAASVVPGQGRNPEAHDLGPGRLALSGYDPVAYFDAGGGRPQEGSEALALEHEGVVYRFASEANRATFAADPARYEPAYGGWCAYAMSQDAQVSVDPLAFRIGEGRLLLFAHRKYLAVDGRWVPKEPALLAAADRHWRRRSGEEARPAPAGSWRRVAHWNLSGESLALEGYDPVSYFAEGGGKPRKGDAARSLYHRGVQYRFASDAHLERFRADPAKYEPQHGGWCSYAMADGERVEVDPQAFRLTGGQLHLFYNGWLGDTRDDWDDDTANLERKADAAWARIEGGATTSG